VGGGGGGGGTRKWGPTPPSKHLQNETIVRIALVNYIQKENVSPMPPEEETMERSDGEGRGVWRRHLCVRTMATRKVHKKRAKKSREEKRTS